MLVNELRTNYVTNCFGEEQSTPAPKEDTELKEVRGIDLTKNGTSQEDAAVLESVSVFGVGKKRNLATNYSVTKLEDTPRANQPLLAATLAERNGAKVQKREVNGEKQEIIIVKNGKNEEKFLVNNDGTLGERLIATSTFGKNKYITQSEHDKRMQQIFPNGVPDGVDVRYADGNIVFEKDGKRVSSHELRELYAEQNAQKPAKPDDTYYI